MNRPTAWLPTLAILFFLSGCGEGRVEVEPVADPSPQVVPQVYHNQRFGYAITLPVGVNLYAIDVATQSAVDPSQDSEILFVPGEETNYLTLRGVATQRSAHEWLTANLLFFYPTGEAAQKISEVDGHIAISLLGDGTAASPARVMVIQTDGSLLVITVERDEPIFDSIIASLTFD